MQTQPLVPDTHFIGTEHDVLQAGGIRLREREVSFQNTGTVRCPDDFCIRQTLQSDKPALADDPLELVAALQKLLHGIRILQLFRNDESPREGIECTCGAAMLLRGFGEEQVAGMIQVRALVEMPLERTGEETRILPARIGYIMLLGEPILLVYDGEVRKHLDSLDPCGVHGLVLGGREGEEFGKRYAITDGQVGVFREYAPLLDTQQRKLPLQRCGFQHVFHDRTDLTMDGNNRSRRRRLMM